MMDEKQLSEIKGKITEQLKGLPEKEAEEWKKRILAMNAQQMEDFLKQSQAKQPCLFCQIACKEIESLTVYESNNIIAVLDIYPASMGHILVMPKQHSEFIFQINRDALGEMINFITEVSPVIATVLKAEGIVIHSAQGIGQRVPHFAFHVIPRYNDDKLSFGWEGKKTTKEELQKTASLIKGNLKPKEAVPQREQKRDSTEYSPFINKFRIP